MKAKLVFNLDEGDQLALLRAVKSTDAVLILWEILNNSYRKLVKHADVSDGYAEGVEAMLSRVRELCEEHDVDPDKLIE